MRILIIVFLFFVVGCNSIPYKPSVGYSFKQADLLSLSTWNGSLVKVDVIADCTYYQTWSQEFDIRVRNGNIDPNGKGYFAFRNDRLIAIYDVQEFRNKVRIIKELQDKLNSYGTIELSTYRNKYLTSDPLEDEINSLNDALSFQKSRVKKEKKKSENTAGLTPFGLHVMLKLIELDKKSRGLNNANIPSNNSWRVQASPEPYFGGRGECYIKEIRNGRLNPNGTVSFEIAYGCQMGTAGSSGLGYITCGKGLPNYVKHTAFTARCY